MYIETSRPRLEGEKARLVSPVFSVAPKNPYGATNTAYCFSFYYHMYGQHIGERKPMTLSFHFGSNSRRNVRLHFPLTGRLAAAPLAAGKRFVHAWGSEQGTLEREEGGGGICKDFA